MTMGHVLAQSVAVEGLENEKKVLGSATEAQNTMPDGHLRPWPRTKFVPEGDFFCSACLVGPAQQTAWGERRLWKRRPGRPVGAPYLTPVAPVSGTTHTSA